MSSIQHRQIQNYQGCLFSVDPEVVGKLRLCSYVQSFREETLHHKNIFDLPDQSIQRHFPESKNIRRKEGRM